ncbi:hypothetical protein NPIL_496291 [Nephila pilipes]|uniref:Uncharacterized protein n=1 Tax=Nephila pilipes TaxID=299642 RepID=A0A8X6PWC8_NEPPI|nr:hypothetical protein NPIL_496291 [Nephila pilipes]
MGRRGEETQILLSYLFVCYASRWFIFLQKQLRYVQKQFDKFPKGKSNEAKQLIKQKLKRRNPPLSWALGCRCYVTCELYLLANISISSRGDQRDRV